MENVVSSLINESRDINNQDNQVDDIQNINEHSTNPKSNSDSIAINQESKSDRSGRVTIEYSSSPLPVEIVGSGDSQLIDGPIVLGGDRVSVGSRPSSARPMSAKKVMVSYYFVVIDL